MARPPREPSTERSVAHLSGQSRNLERRYIPLPPTPPAGAPYPEWQQFGEGMIQDDTLGNMYVQPESGDPGLQIFGDAGGGPGWYLSSSGLGRTAFLANPYGSLLGNFNLYIPAEDEGGLGWAGPAALATATGFSIVPTPNVTPPILGVGGNMAFLTGGRNKVGAGIIARLEGGEGGGGGGTRIAYTDYHRFDLLSEKISDLTLRLDDGSLVDATHPFPDGWQAGDIISGFWVTFALNWYPLA